MDLVAIRPLVTAAEATEAAEAFVALDRAYELSLLIGRQGHDAHQAPHLARRRHHDLCVADLAAGREPDDFRLWRDVIIADDEREQHQARYAASVEAVASARRAVEAAVSAAGAVLLGYASSHRPAPVPQAWERPGPSPAVLAWMELCRSFHWPALDATPAIDHEGTEPRYTRWWPLVTDPTTYRQRDPECGPFTEHCWAELAAGRYRLTADPAAPDTPTAGVLSFANPWAPERRSRERRHKPIVFLDPDGRRIA